MSTLPPGATAWVGVGAAVGPLDSAGAAARRQLCCPYCAAALTSRAEPAGELLAHADRYECPNCRGRWRISLDAVRA